MTTPDTKASESHKNAAAEHTACAAHHMKAAASHDAHNSSDAKASSVKAMDCCGSARKKSASACACSN